jgi:hypothetical protein
MATPSPKRRASPAQPPSRWCCANTVCVVGLPRRLAASSITSSWNRAKACISSNAAPALATIGCDGSPPAPTKPQWQNAGRSRLPPTRTSRRSRPSARPGLRRTLPSERALAAGTPAAAFPRWRRWRPATVGRRANSRLAGYGQRLRRTCRSGAADDWRTAGPRRPRRRGDAAAPRCSSTVRPTRCRPGRPRTAH